MNKARTRFGIKFNHPETNEEFIGEGFLYKEENRGTITVSTKDGIKFSTETQFKNAEDYLAVEVFKKTLVSTACLVAGIEYKPIQAYELK